MVSITSAAALTGVDRRTIRRWIDDGAVELGALLSRAGLHLPPSDIDTAIRADGGDPEACAELALILKERGLHDRAIEWLQRAADKGHADSMHWLARAYLDGEGAPKDQYIGLMWLAKSASLGHAISQAQTQALLLRR